MLAKLNSVLKRKMVTFFFIFCELLSIVSSTCSDGKPIQKATVLSAKILDDYIGYGYPTHPKDHPVLDIELDIGYVCLVAMDYTGKYNLDPADPKCTGLICEGPPGPIKIWTKSQVVKSIIKCIFIGINDNYGESMHNIHVGGEAHVFGSLDMRQRRIVKGCAIPSTLVIKLEIDDEGEKLSSALTHESRQMIFYRIDVDYSPVVMLATTNLTAPETVLCLVHNDRTSQVKDPKIAQFCAGRIKCWSDHKPWTLSFEEIQTEARLCITQVLAENKLLLILKDGYSEKSTIYTYEIWA